METNTSSSANSNPPSQPVKKPETTRPRDPQDREIANGISGAKQIITVLTEDDEVRVPLVHRGYDPEEVNIGSSLQIAAQATFNDRQKAMGEQEAAAENLKKLLTDARNNYLDFRKLARKKFKLPSDLTKLGIAGAMPKDMQRFITVATASYTEAGKAPYAAIFAKKGFAADTFTALVGGLASIDQAVKEQKKTAAAAQAATRTRDKTFDTLKTWISELRETANVAFRKTPEQARKLDF